MPTSRDPDSPQNPPVHDTLTDYAVALPRAPEEAVRPPGEAISKIISDMKGRVAKARKLSGHLRAEALEGVVADYENAVFEMARRAEEERRRADEMCKRNGRDRMTGLHDRGGYETAVRNLAALYDRYLSQTEPLFVLVGIFDIDKFKSVNDTYGHPVGDEVIRIVAAILDRHVRTGDILARFGGDEFRVVMPIKSPRISDLSGAREQISRFVPRKFTIDNLYLVRGEDGKVFPLETKSAADLENYEICQKITISGGISVRDLSIISSHEKFQEAEKDSDEALYVGKKAGRNRITISNN